MTARLPVIVFRLLLLVAVWFLGTSTFSRAENSGSQPTATTGDQTQTTSAPGPILVPDVRDLPYVFAKGVLEDAGLAWRVEGAVDGYAVDLVDSQSVKPGTKLVDTGAPTIVLHLKKNPDYQEVGLPDEASPYAGTKVVLATGDAAQPATATDTGTSTEPSGATSAGTPPTTTTASTAPTTTTSTTTTAPTDTTNSGVSAYGSVDFAAQTTGSPASGSSAPTSSSTSTTSSGGSSTASTARPPAFRVPGAPKEPLTEMPLPARAEMLGAWLTKQTRMTAAATDHFNYQHAWIVTGAKFGWWHGAQALQTLIKVDQKLQSRFGTGASYLAQARAALADVLRKSQS